MRKLFLVFLSVMISACVWAQTEEVETITASMMAGADALDDQGDHQGALNIYLKVLEENKIITSAGGGYGKTYFPSDELELNRHIFNKIWYEIGKKAD